MADPWVKNTQNWLNATYGAKAGWVTVTADGQGGNATVAALTRALQVELGITSLSSNFGDGTLAALTRFGNIDAQTSNKNVVRIVQGGLYVKGYNAGNGELDGVFPSSATTSLRTDMGVGSAASITPKVFKALLTTDAAVLIAGGNATIRRIQQDLNGRYSGRRDFYVGPTDGIYSRNVQQALMFAIQYEIDMADGTANGNFGPGTQSGLKTQGVVSTGSRDSSKYFVHLFQAALNFNGYSVPYDGVYGASTESVVRSFQAFAVLPVTGSASYATWASLLVSTGDPTRAATAADCVTTITSAKAATLVANGYRTVGRYLTNTPDNIPDKNIKPGELATIFAAGMSVFPIFQTGGGTPSHFTAKRGREVTDEAHNAAMSYGFRQGTIIYFTVDWDALDQDIDTKIIPYFDAVQTQFNMRGAFYRIGIYGPRNICSRIRAAGYSVSSFVSGMSVGYSGNLGFPLPSDWAFDQIATVTIGSGAGAIEIDRNVSSGRNAGVTSVSPQASGKLDVRIPATMDRSVFERWINDWFDGSMSDRQKQIAINTAAEVNQGLFDYDELITSLARNYRIRKSLLQAPILWESRVENIVDPPTDVAVAAYYNYKAAYEAWQASPVTPVPIPPVNIVDDSSTGRCQIKGRTAISAINWARTHGFTSEPARDASNWKDLAAVWFRLRDDVAFNIRVCALVLLWEAAKAQMPADALSYTRTQTTTVLSGYNGSASYGENLIGLYDVLESFNGPNRNAA